MTGNFRAESHLIPHLKLQTDNIETENEIKKNIQKILDKEIKDKMQPQNF